MPTYITISPSSTASLSVAALFHDVRLGPRHATPAAAATRAEVEVTRACFQSLPY